MASTRITKEMRSGIVVNIVAGAFKPRLEALEEQKAVLADRLYADAYGKEAEQARKMPPGWIPCGRDLYVKCPGWGQADYRQRDYLDKHISMSRDQPIPATMKAFEIDAKHAAYKQAHSIAREHAAIVEAKEALRSKLTALLHSCTTLKQLREAWPEGEAYYPVEPPSYRTALVPVTLTHEINQMLGIKSKPRSTAQKALAKAAAKTN